MQLAALPYIVKIMPNMPSVHPRPANPLVVAVAYDGLCTFEFGVAVEVFALPRPEMGKDWYRFAVAGIDAGEMRALGGVRIVADGGVDLIGQAGTVIVPGWRGSEAPVPPSLIEALRKAHEQRRPHSFDLLGRVRACRRRPACGQEGDDALALQREADGSCIPTSPWFQTCCTSMREMS